MKTTRRLVTLALLAGTLAAHAQVPGALSYQAYLTDTSGGPIDEAVTVVFSLYDTETGGTPKWTDSRVLDVANGLLSVDLGVGQPPIPEDLLSTPLWLGIRVGGDAEMTPRRPIAASAFALKAADAMTLDGSTVEELIAYAQNGAIPPGARIPIVDLRVDPFGAAGWQTVQIDGFDMALDGRSVAIDFNDGGYSVEFPRWSPLTLEYRYPLGTPSPLGVTPDSPSGFDGIELTLVDEVGVAVTIHGDSVVTSDVTYTFGSGAAAARGGVVVQETVSISGGSFQFSDLSGPSATGPVEVTATSQSSTDTFVVQGTGPQTRGFTVGGGGNILAEPYEVALHDVGPAELGLIFAEYGGPVGATAIALTLQGTPLPGGASCGLARLEGLSPSVVDSGGLPANVLQADRVTYICGAGIGP